MARRDGMVPAGRDQACLRRLFTRCGLSEESFIVFLCGFVQRCLIPPVGDVGGCCPFTAIQEAAK